MNVSYEERIPIIEAVLRRLGRSATVAELYEELRTDERFGTLRRIAATFRYDQDPERRRTSQPVFGSTTDGNSHMCASRPSDGLCTRR